MSRSLTQWLGYAESVHPVGIDLGLARVTAVAERLGLAPPLRRPAPRVVIVAGTNGKGSTCIALEALLQSRGLLVGTTLSPHVHRFNERVRVGGAMADDATLCAAFAAVDAARGDIGLTYFEFSALVALHCFRDAHVDVAVLEVGLGGRLDAFNLVSADVSIITSIGLDHQEYLGDDLQGIGREKAGVMRPGQRVVLGADVTESVVAAAADLGCSVTRLGEDFHLTDDGGNWAFRSPAGSLAGLPWGALAPANCALAIEAAVHLAGDQSPGLDADSVRAALSSAALPGRFERWTLRDAAASAAAEAAAERLLVVDVAHNPAGAAFLRGLIEARYPRRRFVGVLGMLGDKDAVGVADAMNGLVSHWVCVPTIGPRGRPAEALAGALIEAGWAEQRVLRAADITAGLEQAFAACALEDGIVAFGSFNLVERMRELLSAGGVGSLACTPMDLRN